MVATYADQITAGTFDDSAMMPVTLNEYGQIKHGVDRLHAITQTGIATVMLMDTTPKLQPVGAPVWKTGN
ncbi:MAG: hypothetical protein ACHQCE_00355 [Streptosporangiales bacterium]